MYIHTLYGTNPNTCKDPQPMENLENINVTSLIRVSRLYLKIRDANHLGEH